MTKYKDSVLLKTARPKTTYTAYLSPFPVDHPLNRYFTSFQLLYRDNRIEVEDMQPTAQHKFIASHIFGRSVSTVNFDPRRRPGFTGNKGKEINFMQLVEFLRIAKKANDSFDTSMDSDSMSGREEIGTYSFGEIKAMLFE